MLCTSIRYFLLVFYFHWNIFLYQIILNPLPHTLAHPDYLEQQNSTVVDSTFTGRDSTDQSLQFYFNNQTPSLIKWIAYPHRYIINTNIKASHDCHSSTREIIPNFIQEWRYSGLSKYSVALTWKITYSIRSFPLTTTRSPTPDRLGLPGESSP